MKNEIEFLLMLKKIYESNEGLFVSLKEAPCLSEMMKEAVDMGVLTQKKAIEVINERIDLLRLQAQK